MRYSAHICRRRGRTGITRYARLVGHLYMTLEGIFGIAVDVSSTLIILFTIYGAVPAVFRRREVLHRFLLRRRWAASRRARGARWSWPRSCSAALGLAASPPPSRIGAVAWPLLPKSGYGKEAGGGLLAAGGLGAILSPPVLGAAAFLIAEFLKISYLDVILMATDADACFTTSAIFVMVEIDARKFRMANVVLEKHQTAMALAQALLVPLRCR